GGVWQTRLRLDPLTRPPSLRQAQLWRRTSPARGRGGTERVARACMNSIMRGLDKRRHDHASLHSSASRADSPAELPAAICFEARSLASARSHLNMTARGLRQRV